MLGCAGPDTQNIPHALYCVVQETCPPTAGGSLLSASVRAGTTATTPSLTLHATALSGLSLTLLGTSSASSRQWDWSGTCRYVAWLLVLGTVSKAVS